jgi:hypothetical protein
LAGQVQAERILFDLTLAPFEPLTPGSGANVVEKKERLAQAIRDRISKEDLENLRRQLAGRLVAVTVVFLLWKGSPSKSNTRPVKDLDNLLKIVFDVLRQGPQASPCGSEFLRKISKALEGGFNFLVPFPSGKP